MQDIAMQLAGSYRAHSGFRFDAESWEIPGELLDVFNRTYLAVRRMGCVLNASSFAAMQQDCLDALARVFATMQAQCADVHEKRFLEELHAKCVRILGEELAWFSRPPAKAVARLEDALVRQKATQLQSERHFFGQLPSSAVDELRSLAGKDLARFRANAAAGRLRREDLSVNTGAAVHAIRRVLNREFRALGVLDAVSAYTGRKTRVIGLALELSLPQATWWKNAIAGLDRPPKTLYAHLDEGISYPKSIVYLSDVTEQNGPTGCYPGAYEAMRLNPLQEMIGRVVGTVGSGPDSPLMVYYAKQYHQPMSSENFRRHFMRLPESLRFNSHMGWDVLPGSELESQLAASERKMTGSAGTFIAFDGARLLHRGGLMQEGERVALQVIFSDLTFTQRAVSKVKRMFT